jgi:putative ABC transport system permease protein
MQALRSSIKRLRRAPGYALLVVALVAAALAINATAFAALYALLWKPLPYADAEQLVAIRARLENFGFEMGFSPAFSDEIGRGQGVFAAVAGYAPDNETRRDAAGQSWEVRRISPSLTALLGVTPVLGRAFSEDEVQDGKDAVLLLSQQAFEQRFDADPGVLGRELLFQARSYRVIGVMPATFAFPDSSVDAWVPYVTSAAERAADALSNVGNFDIVARLAPNVGREAATAALAARIEAMPQMAGLREAAGLRAEVVPLRQLWAGIDLRALWLLFSAAALLLFVVLANVVNLLLERSLRRSDEFALRAALGATRALLARDAALDVAVLASLGATLALLLVPSGARVLAAQGLVPAAMPLAIGGDLATLGFVFGLSLALIATSALAVGSFVARVLTRSGAVATLAARSGHFGATRLRAGLIVLQIVLTTSLLGASGLLLRSAQQLLAEDLGFERGNLAVLGVDLAGAIASAERPDPATVEALHPVYSGIVQGLAGLPGVTQVGAAQLLPFSRSEAAMTLRMPGAAEEIRARVARIDGDYFGALAIPLLAGQAPSGLGRTKETPAELVVDEVFARRHFPAIADLSEVIGRTLVYSSGPGVGTTTTATIVGIARKVRNRALDSDDDLPTVYRHDLDIMPMVWFAVRSRVEPTGVLAAARALIAKSAPSAEVLDSLTMAALVERSLAQRYALLRAIAAFAATTLLLAGVGLYAVLAFAVRERLRELAVRLALGADPKRLVGAVLGNGLRLAAIGVPIGIVLGALLAGAARERLHQIAPFDPMTWLGVSILIVVVVGIAAIVPAWRAARVDPQHSLRSL